MNTAIIILEILAKYGPAVASQAQRIASLKTEPTQADWDALFARVEKSYDAYISEAEARIAATP